MIILGEQHGQGHTRAIWTGARDVFVLHARILSRRNRSDLWNNVKNREGRD